jgi:hypothetical protein
VTGIRINELCLAGAAGSDRTYRAEFRPDGAESGFRPLSVIAGPSQTGKTTIIDFIRYCLGDDSHPQHEEVIHAVRAALLETELNGHSTVIERAATGDASKFASIWRSTLAGIGRASEQRISTEPPGDPDGLSQFVLSACNLDGVELPDSSVKEETATQLLSIRDLFRVIFVPNERLDNKSLVFEQAHHMVRQKYRQSIDAMFGIHDNETAALASRYRAAREKARAAEVLARTLRQYADTEHPRGPVQLAIDLEAATAEITARTADLTELDQQQRSTKQASAQLRQKLVDAQENARSARIRVRDRRSLIERLDALRGQYADDQRKLNFLLDAERLFDPLQVVVCPACFSALSDSPAVVDARCSLCQAHVSESEADPSEPGRIARETPTAVLEAELRAVRSRLKSLNDYVSRLTTHQRILVDESLAADDIAAAAAQAVDSIVTGPAPWLALRDSITQRITQARLTEQSAKAGVTAWTRVAEAEARHEELELQAKEINSLRRQERQRPDRLQVIGALSERFGQILADIGYPKLQNPYIGDDLIPHVRGLSYTHASSGGMVVIALAWNLALWEIAHERNADAPGLLVIDSPQKNLGHNSKPGDTDFADAQLVENFYAHTKTWLSTEGAGAQLIVVDNSPPASVEDDVVIRFTRDPEVPPYGLIPEAVD